MSSAPPLELFAAYEAFRVAGRHNALASVGLVPGWTQEHMIYVMSSDNYKQLKAQLDASREAAAGGQACGRAGGLRARVQAEVWRADHVGGRVPQIHLRSARPQKWRLRRLRRPRSGGSHSRCSRR